MNKNVLWILVILVLPLLTFQNCGKSSHLPGLSDGNPMEMIPGGNNTVIKTPMPPPPAPKSPFVPRSTETGNPTVPFSDPQYPLGDFCAKMLSCGIVTDLVQCGLDDLRTVEYINLISAYQFGSYEEYTSLVDGAVSARANAGGTTSINYLSYDGLQSVKCTNQIKSTFENCQILESKVRSLDEASSQTTDPVYFQPDWFLPLVESFTQCKYLIYLYEDYPGASDKPIDGTTDGRLRDGYPNSDNGLRDGYPNSDN